MAADTSPTAPRVFVVQHEPSRNISDAERYGTIVVLLPDSRAYAAAWTIDSIVEQLQSSLADFAKDDSLLPMGDPVVIAAAALIAAQRTGGIVHMLKWDRQSARYSRIRLDVTCDESSW